MRYILLMLAIVAGDQLTKYFAQSQLTQLPGATMTFIPGFMNFTYAENTGAAFSMFGNATTLLAILAAVMAAVIIWLLFKYKNKFHSTLYNVAMCFIAAGAIGNCIDRFARGYVVDMLEFDFVNFAVFNVADCFVTFGAIMLGIFIIWFWDDKKGHKKENEKITD